MEEAFIANPVTWIGLASLLVINLIIIAREVIPKLVNGFIEHQNKRSARAASVERAENDQRLELTRQIYEEQKAKDERMYMLMDKFSDRLAVFSEELTKFSITMQMIMTRLENIEKVQHKILDNQEEIDTAVTVIETHMLQQKPLTTQRRRKKSNTLLTQENQENNV